jgi:hypothetical protein
MIMSIGERAVWAAEYIREREEQRDDYWHYSGLAEKEGRPFKRTMEEAFEGASHEAVMAACSAVDELRETRARWEETHRQHPDLSDHDLLMLRTMLGEE